MVPCGQPLVDCAQTKISPVRDFCLAEETADLTYSNQNLIVFLTQQRARGPPSVPTRITLVTVGFQFESCKPASKTNVLVAQKHVGLSPSSRVGS